MFASRWGIYWETMYRRKECFGFLSISSLRLPQKGRCGPAHLRSYGHGDAGIIPPMTFFHYAPPPKVARTACRTFQIHATTHEAAMHRRLTLLQSHMEGKLADGDRSSCQAEGRGWCRAQAGKQQYASLGIHSEKETVHLVESIIQSKLWKTPENTLRGLFTLWEGFLGFHRERRNRREGSNS